MKIAIIGAGIYGCHLAVKLSSMYQIDLYEMGDKLLTGASGFNSYRIHKGYHYPRSGKTRLMCQQDEKYFLKEYGHLVDPCENNPKVFCVADDNRTMMDFETMKVIMQGTDLPFTELSKKQLTDLGYDNVEGGFRVHESIMMVDKFRSWFKLKLEENNVNIYLGRKIENIDTENDEYIGLENEDYDLVINATYNQDFQYHTSKHKHYYDLCLGLVVASKSENKVKKLESFGIFDGAFPSLEPFGFSEIPEEYSTYKNKSLFQIFHVEHTSVAQYEDIDTARKALKDGLSEEKLNETASKMLDDTRFFYPKFDEEFEVIGNWLSIKTKVTDLSDNRPLIVAQDKTIHPRFLQVFSSKLHSIYGAERQVIRIVDKIKEEMISQDKFNLPMERNSNNVVINI